MYLCFKTKTCAFKILSVISGKGNGNSSSELFSVHYIAGYGSPKVRFASQI